MSRQICNLRPLTPDDWDEVAEIYLEGIETRQATFETKVPGWDQWDTGHHQFARLARRHGLTLAGGNDSYLQARKDLADRADSVLQGIGIVGFPAIQHGGAETQREKSKSFIAKARKERRREILDKEARKPGDELSWFPGFLMECL